jgi:hypothetical protein
MNKRELLSTRVALLSVLLLSGHTVAYGQKAPNRQNPLLPDVHLGLNKLGVDAILTPPAAPKAVLPVLPSLSVPGVAVRAAPPIVPGSSVSATVGGGGAGASVTVPPIGGLTPPLGANVNVNTGGSAPVLAVGVDVSGSTLGVSVGDGGIPGAPPAPNFPESGPTAAAQDQLLQERLALLPTCR